MERGTTMEQEETFLCSSDAPWLSWWVNLEEITLPSNFYKLQLLKFLKTTALGL